MMGDAQSVEAKPSKTVTPLKVLIADDDAPTRILLRAAISQWGYQVQEAKDGEEAWNLMQAKDAPRLLILDWLMPKMDGITLCEKSKADPTHHPYIILLTQVTGTSNIIKGLEAGADEFLSKPFNMAELRSRLSTGARIIQHEIDLADRNHLFQNYFEEINRLVNEMKISTKEIEPICKESASFNTLQEKLTKLIQMINNFETESHVKK